MLAGHALGTRWMGAICALSVGIFKCFSYREVQSHIVDARPTHWKSITFCQSVCRASVVLQHSLLIRGGCCTNATHIFARSVIAKGSWVCLKYWTHMNAWMYSPEDRQQHVGRARTTLYQRQIHLLCITWLPIEAAGQSRATRPPCVAWALEANAGHTPAVRPALVQEAVTMLFLQLDPWSSEERHFIFNYLRWCFTRYTALSAEFDINLSKLRPNI